MCVCVRTKPHYYKSNNTVEQNISYHLSSFREWIGSEENETNEAKNYSYFTVFITTDIFYWDYNNK